MKYEPDGEGVAKFIDCHPRTRAEAEGRAEALNDAAWKERCARPTFSKWMMTVAAGFIPASEPSPNLSAHDEAS
jgi:hypothetical protein